MPVSTPNKEYTETAYKRKIVRDCCKGSEAIKAARKGGSSEGGSVGSMAGTFYLPAPNPTDNSEENRLRYLDFKKRANFVNFTGHTKDAFVGMACRKEPVVEVPNILLPMLYNFDGLGNSIYSSVKRSIDEVTQVAREGLLLEFPRMPQGQKLSQTEGVTPTVKSYCAESIINYKIGVKNGIKFVSMVVLLEQVEVKEDEFTNEEQEQYRVLLMEDGVYVQVVYDKDLNIVPDEETGEAMIMPRKFNGEPWGFIPFVFIGALNNDPAVDTPILYDMAEVNISHYVNSADYEDSCHMAGQPTPVFTGLTQHWVDEVLDGSVMLGSRAFVPLPAGASAMLLQANSNTMPMEGMRRKEEQMIQIGAKIITPVSGVETAEAAKIRFAGQNSKLTTLIDNVEQAYEKLLEWALYFVTDSASEEVSISLSKDLYEKGADPQMIQAQIMMLDKQVISLSDVRNYLRVSGNIDHERTDQDIEEDIKEVNPIL